jgi:hypothetical protein
MKSPRTRRIPSLYRKPWYFLAFAISPTLSLLAYNLSQIRPEAGLRSLLLVLALAGLLWGFLRPIYRQAVRASFAASALLLLFFSYGQVLDYLSSKVEFVQLPCLLAGCWLVLALLALAWAGRRKASFVQATVGLNVVALALVLYPTVQIAVWSFPRQTHLPVDDHAPLQTLQVAEDAVLPDIYYIIVDSYGRSDLLDQAFDFDNTDFLLQLEQMGFFIADETQSNYNRTDVSLASSLNLDYLQALDDAYQPPNLGRRTLWESIRHNTVRYQLEQLGYQTYAFATGFGWSEWTDADVFISPSPFFSAMTGFETMLVRTTPLRHLQELGWINLDEIDGQRYRERTALILERVGDVARQPGPKFVFVHIIPPHPPFVYAPDGSPTDPSSFLNADRRYTTATYMQGYHNQAAYISSQLPALLEEILAGSAQPPVIVLQGDHAPWLQSGHRKFLILNAYFLPGHADVLYPTISPVNTFRTIFNVYFGAEYEILPDISYYSPVPNIYEFEQCPNPFLEP